MKKNMRNDMLRYACQNYRMLRVLFKGYTPKVKLLYDLIMGYRYKKINIPDTFIKAIIKTLENINKNKYYNMIDILYAIVTSVLYINNLTDIKLLQSGNLKIDKGIGIFDLPSIMTCKYACKDCYALKSEKIYQNTKIMRYRNYILCNYAILDDNFRKKFLFDFIKQVSKYNIVRFHGSGDIFSKDYLFLLLEIVKTCKDTNFYTYSKQLTNSEIDHVNSLYDNFNIIKSIIDDKYINYGNKEYLKKVVKYLNDNKKDYFVCDYNNNGNREHGTCMKNCKACLHCSHVLFNIH